MHQHQRYPSMTSSYSYRRALPSAVAVSVKTTSENNAILALTRIGMVSSSTLLKDERFMSLLCHILNNDIDNQHLPLLTISASIAASKSQDSTLVHTAGKDKKEESLDDHVTVTIVNTSLLPPIVHTPDVRTVTPIPILNKRKAIKRKAKDKDDHDDNIHLQGCRSAADEGQQKDDDEEEEVCKMKE